VDILDVIQAQQSQEIKQELDNEPSPLQKLLKTASKVTFGLFPEEQTLLRLGRIAKKVSGKHIFPEATHVILSDAVATQLVQLAHLKPADPTDEEIHDLPIGEEVAFMQKIRRDFDHEKVHLLKCFAKLTNPIDLCIAHNIPTMRDKPVYDALSVIRTCWPNLKTVNIHHALDDLPFLFTGVLHRVIYHQASYPFAAKGVVMVPSIPEKKPNWAIKSNNKRPIQLKPMEEWTCSDDENDYFMPNAYLTPRLDEPYYSEIEDVDASDVDTDTEYLSPDPTSVPQAPIRHWFKFSVAPTLQYAHALEETNSRVTSWEVTCPALPFTEANQVVAGQKNLTLWVTSNQVQRRDSHGRKQHGWRRSKEDERRWSNVNFEIRKEGDIAECKSCGEQWYVRGTFPDGG
jgi:hypothetical protein